MRTREAIRAAAMAQGWRLEAGAGDTFACGIHRVTVAYRAGAISTATLWTTRRLSGGSGYGEAETVLARVGPRDRDKLATVEGWLGGEALVTYRWRTPSRPRGPYAGRWAPPRE